MRHSAAVPVIIGLNHKLLAAVADLGLELGTGSWQLALALL